MAESDSVAEGRSEQKERVEAEQRSLAMGMREMKEVAQSTMVSQPRRYGGAGNRQKSEPTRW